MTKRLVIEEHKGQSIVEGLWLQGAYLMIIHARDTIRECARGKHVRDVRYLRC